MQRRLVCAVTGGAVLIAGIGFAGSYTAVRALAERKHFGMFALAFPIGIDAGIIVLLALDLLLSWLRMPFPLLRHTAWLLTVATIAFNAAAAWPDPLGVGMHAVIPVLFVVVVEAARNAVGRLAAITADRHIEPVRLSRWLLSPVPTFRLWRRMKLWELRSYERVIKLEQDRLIYQARLQARHGRRWRRTAPVEALLPLRLAKYGRSLPGSDAQPDPAEVEKADAVDALDQAAAEALALAPPASALAALTSAPAADQPTPDADAQQPGGTGAIQAHPEPEPVEPEPVEPEPEPEPERDTTALRVPPAEEQQPGGTGAIQAHPDPEPDREQEYEPEPAPGTSVKQQQIIQLATRLQSGERITKKTAAPLLGVSLATAQRRLTQARRVVRLAARLKDGDRLTPATAAPLLGVDEKTAGLRLTEARQLNGEGTGLYL
ncbi:DUF2637 domain-containing protein [Streptomyces sp. NPDC056441]|uniref:DUF2637 domain-containing protein n=1 Tax=Streptomyces sp. NPDC056441 TaxID=3345817 RepID=UPI0036BE147D